MESVSGTRLGGSSVQGRTSTSYGKNRLTWRMGYEMYVLAMGLHLLAPSAQSYTHAA